MPPTSGKRKKQQEQTQRVREALQQQYRRNGEGPSMAPPTSMGPPLPPPLPLVHEAAPPASSERTQSSCKISARCKPVPEGAPPKKKRRGKVRGVKAEAIFKRTGKRIKVTWDDFCHGPHSKELNSMLTHDVGYILRDNVGMMAASWAESEDHEQKKLHTKILVFYEFDTDDDNMWEWLEEKAKSVYKNWKSKLNTIRQKHPGKIPEEFEHRVDEWEWLINHFESEEFQRRSAANKRNRDKKTLHHHTGSRPFIYNAKELKDKGEHLYFIKSHSRAYDADRNPEAAEKQAALMKTVDDIRGDLRKENPDISEEDIDLHLDQLQTQANVFETTFKHRNMKEIRGMGFAGSHGLSQRPDKTGTSRSRRAAEIVDRAVEEARQAKEEARETREENTQIKARLQQMEQLFSDKFGIQLPVPPQQQPRDDDGGNGSINIASVS